MNIHAQKHMYIIQDNFCKDDRKRPAQVNLRSVWKKWQKREKFIDG